MIAVRGILLIAALLLSSAAYAQDREWWWDKPFKAFTMPSESMEPSVPSGAYLLATRRAPAELKRGDLALFMVNKDPWIKRVVGLPGDRIALVDGKVLINGKFAAYGAEDRYALPNGRDAGNRQTEQLPGEARPHTVLQLRLTPQDDVAEAVVPANHFYMLGDNRDNSTDSRFSRAEGGIDMVAFDDVYGVIDPAHIAPGKAPVRPKAESSPLLTPVEPK